MPIERFHGVVSAFALATTRRPSSSSTASVNVPPVSKPSQSPRAAVTLYTALRAVSTKSATSAACDAYEVTSRIDTASTSPGNGHR